MDQKRLVDYSSDEESNEGIVDDEITKEILDDGAEKNDEGDAVVEEDFYAHDEDDPSYQLGSIADAIEKWENIKRLQEIANSISNDNSDRDAHNSNEEIREDIFEKNSGEKVFGENVGEVKINEDRCGDIFNKECFREQHDDEPKGAQHSCKADCVSIETKDQVKSISKKPVYELLPSYKPIDNLSFFRSIIILLSYYEKIIIEEEDGSFFNYDSKDYAKDFVGRFFRRLIESQNKPPTKKEKRKNLNQINIAMKERKWNDKFYVFTYNVDKEFERARKLLASKGMNILKFYKLKFYRACAFDSG